MLQFVYVFSYYFKLFSLAYGMVRRICPIYPFIWSGSNRNRIFIYAICSLVTRNIKVVERMAGRPRLWISAFVCSYYLKQEGTAPPVSNVTIIHIGHIFSRPIRLHFIFFSVCLAAIFRCHLQLNRSNTTVFIILLDRGTVTTDYNSSALILNLTLDSNSRLIDPCVFRAV